MECKGIADALPAIGGFAGRSLQSPNPRWLPPPRVELEDFPMTVPVLLTIHTDGASRGNPGPAAFAYVIARNGEEPIEEAGKIGRMTNNQAEYTALVRALEHALESANSTAS